MRSATTTKIPFIPFAHFLPPEKIFSQTDQRPVQDSLYRCRFPELFPNAADVLPQNRHRFLLIRAANGVEKLAVLPDSLADIRRRDMYA